MSRQSIDAMRRCWFCEEDTTDKVCSDCGEDTLDAEQWDAKAEASWESQEAAKAEAFHGGSQPFTMDEQHRAAWHEKQQAKGRGQ